MAEYFRLGSLRLTETGLLSDESTDLNEFVIANELSKVSTFLECIDNNSYTTPTYYDVLLEAKGLAALLKQKYLNIPLENGKYLDKPIRDMEFTEIKSPIRMYGVEYDNGEKKNIHSLINLLGFNDKERQLILKSTPTIENTIIIDLLYNAYKKIIQEDSKEHIVLRNKLLIILNYYIIMMKNDTQSNFMKEFNKAVLEFPDLLLLKHLKNIPNTEKSDMYQEDNKLKR